MPVNILLLEGNLDGTVLGPVMNGNPTLETGCSKGSLGPRCLDQRSNGTPNVCYLRDRDYDYEPPAVMTHPIVDRMWSGVVLGWRWSRHEIENYLLDPAVVAAATSWNRPTYEAALVAAGQSIRHYQIARWCLGLVRRSLPPINHLPSRPVAFAGHDFRTPADLTSAGTSQWARDEVTAFRNQVSGVIGAAQFDQSLIDRGNQLTAALLSTPDTVLTWCSGKDLFTALGTWLQATHHIDSGNFRALLRDWIHDHPEDTVLLLPEWDQLRQIVRAYV